MNGYKYENVSVATTTVSFQPEMANILATVSFWGML